MSASPETVAAPKEGGPTHSSVIRFLSVFAIEIETPSFASIVCVVSVALQSSAAESHSATVQDESA